MSGADRQCRGLLAEVLARPAWAIIRARDDATVTLLGGTRTDLETLAEIPLATGPPLPGRAFDSLVLVPYAQIRERGFEAHQDGTPLTHVAIDRFHEVPLDDLVAALPDQPVEIADAGGFDIGDDDYAAVVAAILRDEIGKGEGANLVVARTYVARLSPWGTPQALGVLRRLLERERGAYWTFCVFTGDRYLIGASPERHVSVDAGSVRMNPISGTFRLAGLPEEARKPALLDFLADEKEIYELFMVVDEELKMMCDICDQGGLVLGPFLKQMSYLMHTEYLLAGRSSRDVRDVLRDSMFAATVTGSPVQNACRLITRYEPAGRGYYGAVMALLGRAADGSPVADAPILIRTADVDLEGRLSVTAGATLVRDSDPAYEVAETHAKAAGVLTAFGLLDPAPVEGVAGSSELERDEDVLIALASRNSRLSGFWLSEQTARAPDPELVGRRALIVDGEDDFVNMLRHVLAVQGVEALVAAHQQWSAADLDRADLVVVGPGPGDPRDSDHPKIAAFSRVIDATLGRGTPLLAVCLGHQVLCQRLGLPLAYKDVVFQGTQSLLPVLGRPELVGFYNTFVARLPTSGLPAGVTVETDPATGDIHVVRGRGCYGVQFHAESILTQHGDVILRDLVRSLLAP